MDEAAIRASLVRHWAYAGVDEDVAHEIYHDDAVLEFPQSGERFVGREAFLAWRKQYPAKLAFRIRRITHTGDLWVFENLISYDGAPPMFTVNMATFRDDRIAREVIYIMEGFEPAGWRTPWVTSFDRLASIAPADWREGEPFGIG